jgi:putative ABC transport system permease protein
MNLSLLWLLIRRQWRTNSLPLLALAVMIAVGSLSTVMLLTSRMQQAVNQQTSETLGADAIVKSIDPIADAWINKAQQLNLRTSVATSFTTMVSYNDALQLSALKAVDANYPLYSGLTTEPPLTKNPNGPTIEPGKVWLDPILSGDLNAQVGDTVQIGVANFTIAGLIQDEPDRSLQFINFAPRALISAADLSATQLIQPGSNVTYQLSLAGESQPLEEFLIWVKPQLASSQQIVALGDTQPQLNSIILRLQNYFSLVALFAVGLAGVAIAVVARHYTRQQYDICALFRCLGANQTTYLYWQCGVLLAVGVIGAIAGCLIGYLTHYAVLQALSLWLSSVAELPPPKLWLLSISGVQGILIMLAFAVPPLLRLREVSPLRLLRKDLTPPSPSNYFSYGLAAVGLIILLIWQTQQVWLSVKLIGVIFAGILVLLPLLYFSIKGIINIASRSKKTYLFVHLLSLRTQLGNASMQVIATTLVLTLLILLQSLRANLINEWQGQLPENTPNQFLINISSSQIDPIRQLLTEHHLAVPTFYPIVAGRLAAVNDKPISLADYPPDEAPNALRRALQLTWTDKLPIDNIVTSGKWFEPNNTHPAISMDQKTADQLNVHLNDTLTFMIGAQAISAPVTSMRDIEWGSFQPNFFVIFTPGVLDNFAHTYITSFYLPNADKDLRYKFHNEFPNVSLIDIGTIIRNAQSLLGSASNAIEITLLFSLAAAVIVLITIFYTSFQQRYLTNAILRSIGARSSQLIMAILIEYIILAVLSGAIAIVMINVAWWWLAHYVFNFAYEFNVLTSLYTLLVAIAIYSLMGLLGAIRLIRPSAQRLLTAELG